MAAIRITYQSNTAVENQWAVTEVGGAYYRFWPRNAHECRF